MDIFAADNGAEDPPPIASVPLTAPPAGIFASAEEGYTFVQSWAKDHKYAVSKSSAPKGGRWTYLACTKSGKYRNTRKLNEDTRQRKTSSAKTSCPFQVRLKNNEDGTWSLSIACGEHNHPPAASGLTHAIQRRVDVATGDQILELVRHNNKPSQIIALLAQREDPVSITAKDVTNFVAKHHRRFLHGRAPAEALLEWLKERGWPHEAMTTHVGGTVERLDGLFFAHPVGLHLLKRFGTVTVIDATYNTNQHRLPLLHFIGFTSSNKSFTIGLAFLPDETPDLHMGAQSPSARGS